MTTHQAVAIAFPILTLAAVVLTGLGIKRWLDRRYPASELTTTRDVVDAELTEAIDQVISQIERGMDARRSTRERQLTTTPR